MRRAPHSLLAAVLAIALSLLLAAQSSAAPGKPKGEFAPFSQCPLTVATLSDCVYFHSSGGTVAVGSRQLELAEALTLQGGFAGAGEKIEFFGAANGETLSKPVQALAGLLAVKAPSSWPDFLREWFDEGVKEGHTGVIATIELLGPSEGLTDIKLSTENLLAAEGTALALPVRVSLSNDLLGTGCHIGSASEPLQLNLTAGRSGALQGRVGPFTYNQANTASTMKDGKLVDGTYSAPRASGCGGLFSYYVDPLVDSLFSLPSARGENQTVLGGEFSDGQAEAVRAAK